MLNIIKKELQDIAETISAVVGIDITIIDKNLIRVAGTGRLKQKIGTNAPRGSVFEKCLLTGNKYFLTDPGNCIECIDCEARSTCQEEAEVCFPIVIDNHVEGVIGMIIFAAEQKKMFVDKQDSYENFDKRMGELISAKIRERKISYKLKDKSMKLLTVIDSVNEGIIIIDEEYKIVNLNKFIKNKLNLNDNIIGKNIANILPEDIVSKYLQTNFKVDEEEIRLYSNQEEYNFLLSIIPVKLENKITGAVITLKDFKKLQRSVFKIREETNKFTFNDMIGSSSIFSKVKEQAKQIAKQDVAVLLLGESGTGKELFARAVHAASNRKNQIFMPINCGAIPENLVESELFGYEKGAFTGASKNGKIGKFEISKDGTIFLDEIGDLPLHMQVKLLRVLEEKEIMRVGGVKSIKVNPRIIAATHKNLYQMVKNGEFREDLYYRLNVIPLEIPPLRDRDGDVLELAQYFLKRFNSIYKKTILGFTEEAQKALLGYHWPGNVRELQNLVEYTINFTLGDKIDINILEKRLKSMVIKDKELNSLKDMVEQYEKNLIRKYLKIYGDSLEGKRKIAQSLKISLATLYRKLD